MREEEKKEKLLEGGRKIMGHQFYFACYGGFPQYDRQEVAS